MLQSLGAGALGAKPVAETCRSGGLERRGCSSSRRRPGFCVGTSARPTGDRGTTPSIVIPHRGRGVSEAADHDSAAGVMDSSELEALKRDVLDVADDADAGTWPLSAARRRQGLLSAVDLLGRS